MNIRVIFCLLALAGFVLPNTARAQTNPLDGLWLTQDHGGVIQVASCGDRLCARIAGVVLDNPSDSVPVDYQGTSQCGLPLISDARQIQPGLWRGHILDPRNGKVYGVELHLDDQGHLRLRGFLGVPLFGQTETWTRFDGAVPDDCRMVPGGSDMARGQPNSRHSG